MTDHLTEGDGWAVIANNNYATIALDPNCTNQETDKAWAAALGDGLVDWIETRKGGLDEYPEWTVINVYYKTRIVEDVE